MIEPGEDETVEILVPSHVEREGNRIRERLRDMNPETERMFRINAGCGWISNKIKRQGEFMILHNPRPLQAGPEGWFDVCGWTSIDVTMEMVGMKIAVFTGEEFKRVKNDAPRGKQKTLGDLLVQMGGIHRVIRP
jgi:hypothetical protein